MKKKEYKKPEVEAHQLNPVNVICTSSTGYSENIFPDGTIIDDSYFDR